MYKVTLHLGRVRRHLTAGTRGLNTDNLVAIKLEREIQMLSGPLTNCFPKHLLSYVHSYASVRFPDAIKRLRGERNPFKS